MKYNLDELSKKLNKINLESEILNEKFKDTVNYVSQIDETNETRELKYSLYEGNEKLYQIHIH